MKDYDNPDYLNERILAMDHEIKKSFLIYYDEKMREIEAAGGSEENFLDRPLSWRDLGRYTTQLMAQKISLAVAGLCFLGLMFLMIKDFEPGAVLVAPFAATLGSTIIFGLTYAMLSLIFMAVRIATGAEKL